MPLGMEVGLGSGDFAFDGDPATSRKKAHPPQPILAHVYCGQTAGWIKMTLVTEVGLGPDDIVLDGDFAPSPIRGQSPPPILGPYLLWLNGWMDQDGS